MAIVSIAMSTSPVLDCVNASITQSATNANRPSHVYRRHPEKNGASAQISAAAWLGFANPNPCRTASPITSSTKLFSQPCNWCQSVLISPMWFFKSCTSHSILDDFMHSLVNTEAGSPTKFTRNTPSSSSFHIPTTHFSSLPRTIFISAPEDTCTGTDPFASL